MNTVRAKFVVNSVTESKYQSEIQKTVKLLPVYGNSEENKKFFKWTPTGSIELGILNKDAADSFMIGGEYYVDFTPAFEPGQIAT